jgi:hypothetical protein
MVKTHTKTEIVTCKHAYPNIEALVKLRSEAFKALYPKNTQENWNYLMALRIMGFTEIPCPHCDPNDSRDLEVWVKALEGPGL